MVIADPTSQTWNSTAFASFPILIVITEMAQFFHHEFVCSPWFPGRRYQQFHGEIQRLAFSLVLTIFRLIFRLNIQIKIRHVYSKKVTLEVL